MTGLIGLAGWAFVGLVVSVLERRLRVREADNPVLVTVMCVAGALIGGAAGQTFLWYFVGEPLGFVSAAAGAELLLLVYRARGIPPHVPGEAKNASPVPPVPVGTRIAGAFGWGMPSAIAATILGAVALAVGSSMYPQRYMEFPAGCFVLPLGATVGFFAIAAFRLVWPRSTAVDMLLVIAVVGLAVGGFVLHWTWENLQHPVVRVVLNPTHVIAMPCSAASCPPGTPAPAWTIRGAASIEEQADVEATVESIEVVGYEPIGGRQPMVKAASVRYAGGQIAKIVGSNQLPPNRSVSFPIRYDYATVKGGSRMNVSVYVVTTDAFGKRETWTGSWNVR